MARYAVGIRLGFRFKPTLCGGHASACDAMCWLPLCVAPLWEVAHNKVLGVSLSHQVGLCREIHNYWGLCLCFKWHFEPRKQYAYKCKCIFNTKIFNVGQKSSAFPTHHFQYLLLPDYAFQIRRRLNSELDGLWNEASFFVSKQPNVWRTIQRSSRQKPQPTGRPKPLAYRRYHKSVSCLTHSLNSPWNRGSGTAATLGLKRRRPRRFKLTRVSVESQGWFLEWGTFMVKSRPLWAVWGD